MFFLKQCIKQLLYAVSKQWLVWLDSEDDSIESGRNVANSFSNSNFLKLLGYVAKK